MIVDYAMPTMLAEKALKQLHEAMLMKNYNEAAKHCKDALGHVADIQHAIIAEAVKEQQRRQLQKR